MIGMLAGRVVSVDAVSALIDVHGIGFVVRMPAADLGALHAGTETTVYTSMSVSQDAITLFGFLEASGRTMFLQLQKASGIGPKVALSILSTLSGAQIAKAIADGDAAALAKAPGLGKKGAQKIILELKGTVALDEAAQASAPGAPARQPEDAGILQVVEALLSLGWRQQDAREAVDHVVAQGTWPLPLSHEDVPEALRAALTFLDKGR